MVLEKQPDSVCQLVNIPFLGQFYIGLAKVHKFSI